LNIVRGGRDGERRRIHKRERFSAEIALKLAAYAQEAMGQPASYIVWNRMTAKKGDPKNLDPNYLTRNQSPYSVWHQALHEFQEHFANGQHPVPIFHVDIHGKMDRKDNLDLDIGMGPMENCWGSSRSDAEATAEVESLKEHLASGMREAFRTLKGKVFLVHGKQMQMTVEDDPYLNAYWGGGTFETISHQSVNLRIPAIQLEVPLTMRRELMRNDQLFRRFAGAIYQSYKYMVSNFKCIESKPRVCGCALHLSAEQRANLRAMANNGRQTPPAKSLEETELFLRELAHLERTIMEKQI